LKGGHRPPGYLWAVVRRLPTIVALLGLAFTQPARAQSPLGSIDGLVITVDRVPVSNALVTIGGDGAPRVQRTDARGRFRLAGFPPGTYSIQAVARGFVRSTPRVVDVRTGEATSIELQLSTSTTSLTTIGTVSTKRGDQALSTSSAPMRELSAQDYAARGYTSVAQMLASGATSATVIRTVSGSPNGPVVVALRGPDPTETLVDVDGHAINSGGTGAFDLTMLDPAALSSVQLVYGISPSSLVGPNTIDGAVNVRTIEPSTNPSTLFRVSQGSFGTFGATVQGTGTYDNVGYAVSMHAFSTQGAVNQAIPDGDGTGSNVGSGASGSSILAKLQVPLERGSGRLAFSFRDQAASRDLSAPLTTLDQTSAIPVYTSFAGSLLQAHNAGYGLDVLLPVGQTTLLFRHLTSVADQSVFGPAAGTSPYLYDDHDLLADDTLEFERAVPKGSLSLKLAIRNESLDTEQISGATTDQSSARDPQDVAVAIPTSPLTDLMQRQRSTVLRYTVDPTVKLHYTVAAYYSNFSSFGTSFDPRFGFVWTPNAQSAAHLSVGTTFQAPQLPELYVPPALPPVGSNGYVNVGNPNLKADHATDYDLGFEHRFAGDRWARARVDVYQTNLRTPSQRYYSPTPCPPAMPPECLSFPINIGGAIYRGIELSLDRLLAPSTTLHAAYSVNSAFATTVSPEFQNGTIVPGEQFQGVPLHKAVLEVSHNGQSGLSYNAGLTYEDSYNELNRPAFATVEAGLSYRLRAFSLALYGTNLTNVYANPFTLVGQGIPYGGVSGPIPTNAYALPATAVQLLLTYSAPR